MTKTKLSRVEVRMTPEEKENLKNKSRRSTYDRFKIHRLSFRDKESNTQG